MAFSWFWVAPTLASMEATVLMAAWTAEAACEAADAGRMLRPLIPSAPVVAAWMLRLSWLRLLAKAPTCSTSFENEPSSRLVVPKEVVWAIWSIWLARAWNSWSLALAACESVVAPLADDRASEFIVCRIEAIWLRAPLAVWIIETPFWALLIAWP